MYEEELEKRTSGARSSLIDNLTGAGSKVFANRLDVPCGRVAHRSGHLSSPDSWRLSSSLVPCNDGDGGRSSNPAAAGVHLRSGGGDHDRHT